jgi:hypothetical protein
LHISAIEQLEAAMQRGAQMDLDAVVKQLLAENSD